MPSNDVTSLQDKAGEALIVDFAPFHAYLKDVENSIFAILRANGTINPDTVGMASLVKVNIDVGLRSLRALKSYTSTSTIENGRKVTHSWLHVEDIGE